MLLKRILSIAAAGLITLAACQDNDHSPQGIFYSTVNDTLKYNHHIALDLNRDNIGDYFLTSVLMEENDQGYLYLLINRESPQYNKYLINPNVELASYGFWAEPLEKGIKINASAAPGTEWNSNLSKGYLISISEDEQSKIWRGQWIGKKDKYLGLKFLIGGKYHYGWLRISHSVNDAKLYIADYAYNQQPETPIAAGEK